MPNLDHKPKLKLNFAPNPVKSFADLAKVTGLPLAEPEPPLPRSPDLKVLDEGKPMPPPERNAWAQLPNGQWLRLVMDNRVGAGRRVYRVELFDKSQQTLIAIFRRAP